jgi:hypothetical protein
MWPAFKIRSEIFSQPWARSGVIVDFLENVWYFYNPISEKGMGFCFVCQKNAARRG